MNQQQIDQLDCLVDLLGLSEARVHSVELGREALVVFSYSTVLDLEDPKAREFYDLLTNPDRR